jgi:hypothetical protein
MGAAQNPTLFVCPILRYTYYMSQNQKKTITVSIAIATIFTLGLTFAIWGLIRSGSQLGTSQAAPPLAKTAPTETEEIPTESKPALVRGQGTPATGLPIRSEWSQDWQKRMMEKGWRLKAKTSGEEQKTLELHWGKDRTADDDAHRERLKTYEGFQMMLRNGGFTKLEMWVEGKKVFEKPL